MRPFGDETGGSGIPTREGAEAVVRAFEELPAAVGVFAGPEHVIRAVNRAARAMSGDRPHLVGLRYREAFPELSGQRMVDVLDEVYSTGRPVSRREWRLLLDRTGNGELEELYVDFTVVPVRDDRGAVTELVSHVVDVTDLVAARQIAQADAEAAEQRYRSARDVVLAMQRSLLPDRLPVLPRLRLAAHYLLAHDEQAAGGDWFDAVPLDGQRVGLVVGDVVGHGPAAAAVMGQLRSVLTQYLLEGYGVAAALARLDRFVARLRGATATTVCLVLLDTATGELDYASCGHPPPLRVQPPGSARYLPATGGGPLGVVADPPQVGTTRLTPGEVLLLHTDGLTERRHRDPRVGADLLRLVAADALRRASPRLMAHDPAHRVGELTIERMTRDGHDDDVSVLAVRLRPAPEPLHLELAAVPAALPAVRDRLGDWLTGLGVSTDDERALQLAVGEAVANAAEHAYPDDGGAVSVEAALDDSGRVSVTVSDRGTWRRPAPGERGRGRGLQLIRAGTDTLEIDTSGPGTVVLMDRQIGVAPTLAAGGDGAAAPAGPAQHTVRVDATASDTGPRVAVAGWIDMSTVAGLRRHLDAACRGGALPLTVDLTAVAHLGSAGIQLLYEYAELAPGGQPLQLIAPAGSAARFILTLAGLDRLVDARR